jgi:hypothetical protein
MKMRRKFALVLTGVIAALALASLAGTAAAGSGSPAAVNAVEGQPFNGTVATYTSTVTVESALSGAGLPRPARPLRWAR